MRAVDYPVYVRFDQAFVATCPDFPHLAVTSDDLDQARADLLRVIATTLESLTDRGLPHPRPTTEAIA